MWLSRCQSAGEENPPNPRPLFSRGELSEPFENVGLPIKNNRTRAYPRDQNFPSSSIDRLVLGSLKDEEGIKRQILYISPSSTRDTF